jgi:DNA helicase TIP49 (TBP-interacting protein)
MSDKEKKEEPEVKYKEESRWEIINKKAKLDEEPIKHVSSSQDRVKAQLENMSFSYAWNLMTPEQKRKFEQDQAEFKSQHSIRHTRVLRPVEDQSEKS